MARHAYPIAENRFRASGAACAVILVLCAAVSAVAQPPRTDEEQAEARRLYREHSRLLEEEKLAAKARELQIDLELERLGDRSELAPGDWAREWAGVYSQGGGYGGLTLKIAPESGWYFENWTHIGVSKFNHGEVVDAGPDGLHLSLAIDPAADPSPYMGESLILFRWGDVRCALPESRIYEFCNGLNQERGSLRPDPGVLKRSDDAKKSVTGPPSLPAKYAAFLHDQPVEALITKVEDVRRIGGQLRARVTISKGSDEGVFPQQRFQTRQNSGWADLEVVETSGQSATLVFWVSGSALADPEPPKVNQQISTHARSH